MSLKRFQRRLIRILTVLVLLSAVFCAGLYVYRTFLGYNYDSTLYEEDLAAGIKADENITNIALFGLDPRDGDTQSHSDCTMIVSVDNTRGKIKLISLMRDSLVAIDGYGMDKLNAAYWAGGPSLAIRTLNENFGTDITEYIAVNFEQLVEIIDALDGVEIDVQQSELDELNRVIRDYGIEQGQTFQSVESAGVQTLDGVQALCYGRIRKGVGDDWARVERQGIVLQAMFTKVQSMDASGLIGLMQKLMPYVTTSLSATEIAPLIVGALQHGVPELEHARVPLDGNGTIPAPPTHTSNTIWILLRSISERISMMMSIPGKTRRIPPAQAVLTVRRQRPAPMNRSAALISTSRPPAPCLPTTVNLRPAVWKILLHLLKRVAGTIRKPEIITIPMATGTISMTAVPGFIIKIT